MNPLNLKSLLLLSIVLLNISGFAQTNNESTASKSSLSLTIEPLYFINRTTKLDIEFKPKKHLFAYILSPEIFAGTVYDGSIFSMKNKGSDEIKGFGIGLQQKISFKVKSNSVPYLAYGVTYRYNSINYNDEGFVPYQSDGLSFYEYRKFNDALKINTLLFSTLLGVQVTANSNFQFDTYAGAGYKSSTKTSMVADKRDYNKNFTDYAYEGFLFQLGFKVGYKIL